MSFEGKAAERGKFGKLAPLVLQAEDPEIKTKGFPGAVLALLKELDLEEDLRADESGKRKRRIAFVPDAFKIDRESHEVIIYEIEDAHPLSIQKFYRIMEVWELLDGVGWDLRLIVTDRYVAKRGELNLEKWDLALTYLEVKQRKPARRR